MQIVSSNPRDLITRLNFVLTSRKLSQDGLIEEHLPIPSNREEEQKAAIEMMFRFLKSKFTGCRIRTNTYTFSIRFDGEVNIKAQRLRKEIYDNYEWRRWLEQNHRELYRILSNNHQSYRAGNFDKKERDGKLYLYIPHRIDRIPGYINRGIMEFIQIINQEYNRDLSLSGIYDQVMDVIAIEVKRREDEARARLEKELRTYNQLIKPRLIKSINELSSDRHTASGKLRAKIITWCNEKGIEPVYVQEPTYENIVPVGTKVNIVNRIGEKEKDWYVAPIFSDKYEIPEGFQRQEGWGTVTSFEPNGERSRNGEAPVVVENYLYLSFDFEYWKQLAPAGYLELLEVTRQFREEAEAECLADEDCCEEALDVAQQIERDLLDFLDAAEIEPRQEAEQEQEPREGRIPEERPTPEQEQRRRQLADQLRMQLAQQPEQEQDEEEEGFDFQEEEEAQIIPTPTIPTTTGFYRNAMAIPLERYAFVNNGRVMKRSSSLQALKDWVHTHTAFNPRDFEYVMDYQTTDVRIERLHT